MTDRTDPGETVDVLCLGGGGGLVAAAVLAADAGHDVVLARCALAAAGDDPALRPFAALVEGLRSDAAGTDPAVPRCADPRPSAAEPEPEPEGPTRRRSRPVTVAPFVGARLQPWAQQCLDAGHGVVADRPSGRPPADAPVDADGPVEHAVLGVVTLDPGSPGESLRTWLADRLAGADVEVREPVTLRALVLDEESGALVGAELTGVDGRTVTVRARHGIVFGFGTAEVPTDVGAPDGPLHVALIGRPASRFARLAVVPAD